MEFWFILAFLSALSLAISVIFQRILLREKKSDPFAYSIIFQIIASFFVLAFALIQGFDLNGISNVIPNVVLMSFLYAAGTLLIFNAFKIAEASEVTIVVSSSALWNAAGSVLFLGENVTTAVVLGTLLIVAGIVVVSHKREKWKLSRGHLFALLAALFYGLAFVNDSFIVRTLDVPSYLFIAFLLPGIVLLLFRPNALNPKLFSDPRKVFNMLLLSLFWGAAATLVFTAIQLGGPASQVYPVHRTSVIATVILSAIFLKERSNLWNKVIGSILVFLGVALLS